MSLIHQSVSNCVFSISFKQEMDYATSKHKLDVFSLCAIDAKQMTVLSATVIQTLNHWGPRIIFLCNVRPWLLRKTVRNANSTYRYLICSNWVIQTMISQFCIEILHISSVCIQIMISLYMPLWYLEDLHIIINDWGR